jgi:secondary thiamine-phosphate synthase enzyme
VKTHRAFCTVETRGHTEVHDLTEALRRAVVDSGIREGQALVFVAGSTAGVTTIEFEPGLRKDLPELFERLAPEKADYHHHATWGDDNGAAHLRAALLGPSVVVPIAEGAPLLGEWQQVVLVDFDTRPRHRRVLLQAMGE